MRRLLVLMAGLGVLPAATGCCHTAGFCDCYPPVTPCCVYGLYPPAVFEHAVAVAAPAAPDAPAVPERLAPPREGQ
ncbi:MAG TPA: hypothetical protein VL371_18980 [Gemmataceae bacterium]|jgi:hypothetical protein|nr:hypothetical protein [Gemmataceae bacterium]